jgi:hypothetical protein
MNSELKAKQLIEDMMEKVMPNLDDVQPPIGLSNEETQQYFDTLLALYRYNFASIAEPYFKKVKDKTKRVLEDQSVFDYTKVNPGEEGIIYEGAIQSVKLKVNNPSKRVDTNALCNALRKAGVAQEVIDKAKAEATKESSPAKSITVIDN